MSVFFKSAWERWLRWALQAYSVMSWHSQTVRICLEGNCSLGKTPGNRRIIKIQDNEKALWLTKTYFLQHNTHKLLWRINSACLEMRRKHLLVKTEVGISMGLDIYLYSPTEQIFLMFRVFSLKTGIIYLKLILHFKGAVCNFILIWSIKEPLLH